MRFVILLAGLATAPVAAQATTYNRDVSGYAFERPFVYSPQGTPGPVTHPLASGNDCGVDRPVPVWGAGNALLGYACERRPTTR